MYAEADIRQFINRSIDCPPYPGLFSYPDGDSLYACSWLRAGCWEDWAREINTVGNRDTGLGPIENEKTQGIYIL
jgi:hypothetical protein